MRIDERWGNSWEGRIREGGGGGLGRQKAQTGYKSGA